MKISVIVPVYNEEESLVPLAEEIKAVFVVGDFDYEIIFVDDGSVDQGLAVLKSIALADRRVKIISFRKNQGQTAALVAGIKFASGDIIVPMDADLENDPRDIRPMIAKINEGYDLVSGWRQGRWRNKFFTRRLPSWLANALISAVTGVKLNDYGCTLKAYRQDILKDINLYGEMHRFIPVYAKQLGAKIAELPVNHRPRKFGKTKYGLGRTLRVLLDLLVIQFLHNYHTKPIHFFGGAGFLSLLAGFAVFAWALYLKFFQATSLIQTPLSLLAAFLCLVGGQLILLGLIAEMITRNYYESQDKPIYSVKETINFD